MTVPDVDRAYRSESAATLCVVCQKTFEILPPISERLIRSPSRGRIPPKRMSSRHAEPVPKYA